MRKSFVLFFVFIFGFVFSQKGTVLTLKFDEKGFLSKFISNQTNNQFILEAIKESDNIKSDKNYAEVLNDVLNRKIDEPVIDNLTEVQKKEYDSLILEIKKGSFLKLVKEAVATNFDIEFLQEKFRRENFQDFKITKPDYNIFKFEFKAETDKLKVLEILKKNSLTFHQSISNEENALLENCIFKAHKDFVRDNLIKRNGSDLLFYSENPDVFKQLENSKCLKSNIQLLIQKDFEFDTYSKFFPVLKSNELEAKLSKSIKSYSVQFEDVSSNIRDRKFKIHVFLDQYGKESLREFSNENLGKKIFIASNSEVVMQPEIKAPLQNGSFMLTGNVMDVDINNLFNAIRFDVFKNSVIIK